MDSYNALLAAIADWLNRSDLTARIPTFVTLAEKQLAIKVRRRQARATISIASRATALPSDAAEPTALVLSTSSAWQDKPLEIVTAATLAEMRALRANIAGRPTHAAVVGGEILVAPDPDQTYSAELTYVTTFTPLSTSVQTNDIFTEAPHAYLFGALKEAAPFLEHDDRVPLWEAKFKEAVDDLNARRWQEEHGAGFGAARLPRVF